MKLQGIRKVLKKKKKKFTIVSKRTSLHEPLAPCMKKACQYQYKEPGIVPTRPTNKATR